MLLLALAAVSFVHFREAPTVAPEMRTEIVTPSTSDPMSFALSPDGRQIVFVASGDGAARLWLRRLDATSAQPLAGTEGASYPFWSPDSRSVGFFADSKLKRIDIGGGSPQTLTDAANRGGTWGPDGTHFVCAGCCQPTISHPCVGRRAGGRDQARQAEQPSIPAVPAGRTAIPVLRSGNSRNGWHLPWFAGLFGNKASSGSRHGRSLFARRMVAVYPCRARFLARRLDLGRGELTGDPVTVADPVAFDLATTWAPFPYRPPVWWPTGRAELASVNWSGLTARERRSAPWAHPTRIVCQRRPFRPMATEWRCPAQCRGNGDIWLLDATRTTRFTFDPSLDRFPIWSPDGSRIVFDSNRKGHRDLYLKPSNGAGSEELLLESAEDKSANDWSRDGRFLLYAQLSIRNGIRDIWVLPMEGDRKPFVFLKTGFDQRRGKSFPRTGVGWRTCRMNRGGMRSMCGHSAETSSGTSAGGQWQVSTSGGISPRWRADGKELYYIAPDGKLMAAPITAKAATIEPGMPVALFQTRIYGGGTDINVGTSYDVSGDGRFLIDTVLEDAASPITLLQNWTAGLKK